MSSAPETYVNQYRVRLDPKASYGQEQLLGINLEGTDAPTMGLHVRSGVAEFVPDVATHYREPDVSITMSMEAWAGYFVGDITLDELLERNDVKTSNKDKVKTFFNFFDQVHPSKTTLIQASTIN